MWQVWQVYWVVQGDGAKRQYDSGLSDLEAQVEAGGAAGPG